MSSGRSCASFLETLQMPGVEGGGQRQVTLRATSRFRKSVRSYTDTHAAFRQFLVPQAEVRQPRGVRHQPRALALNADNLACFIRARQSRRAKNSSNSSATSSERREYFSAPGLALFHLLHQLQENHSSTDRYQPLRYSCLSRWMGEESGHERGLIAHTHLNVDAMSSKPPRRNGMGRQKLRK